jgi:hypothetical protein
MLNLRPALLALLLLALHLRSKSVSALPENSGWISHDYGASFQESAILLCEVAAGLQVVIADGVLAVIGGDQNDDHEEGHVGDDGGVQLHRVVVKDGRLVIGEV